MNITLPSLLIVSNDSTKTGAPSQILLLVDGLKDRYEITVCCPAGWLHDQLASRGIPLSTWPEGQLNEQLTQLSELFFSLKPNLIHCHGSRAGIVGRLAKRPKTSVALYTEHLWTSDFHLLNPLRESIQHYYLTRAARRGDWVIAVSEAVARFVTKKHQADKEKISVIYGAIPPLAAGPVPHEPIIGTLGRISAVKGIPTLLEACAKLTHHHPELQLVIGGTGKMLQDCQDLAEKLHLSSHCQWLGEVDDPAQFYRRIRIYVQASTSESFGLAAGEAMSCGRVVVASRVGGLPELVTDGENGLLFSAGTIADLAKKLELLLTDTATYTKLSAAGQIRAREFSLERYLHEHITLYEKLLHVS